MYCNHFVNKTRSKHMHTCAHCARYLSSCITCIYACMRAGITTHTRTYVQYIELYCMPPHDITPHHTTLYYIHRMTSLYNRLQYICSLHTCIHYIHECLALIHTHMHAQTHIDACIHACTDSHHIELHCSKNNTKLQPVASHTCHSNIRTRNA